MRPYDRDYYVSTMSVLANNVRGIMNLCDDLMLRIDELEETLILTADEQEHESFDRIEAEAWQAGFDHAAWENDKIVYDSSRKDKFKWEDLPLEARPKICMCDDCWDDSYDHRMD